MAVLPGLAVSLTLDSSTFIAETRRVDASVNRLGQSVARQNASIERSFGGITRTVGVLKQALIGLVGAVSVGALGQLGKAALDNAGNLGELARAAGVSTKQLQVLTVAGTQAGISQEQLATGLGLFARNVGEAANGTGQFREVLQRSGIAIRDASGAIRPASALLADYADRVQNAGSEQEKLSLLQDAFGRSGRQFINILGEGSEGLKAFEAQAEAAGLILSDRLIGQADQASDAIATLQLAVGTGFQIGVVQQFAESVTSSTEALRQAREAGEAFGNAVGLAMRGAAVAAAFVADNWRALTAAGAALVALKLAGVIAGIAYSMVQLATAIRSGAVAMAIFNSVAGKNVFVILAKSIVAAVTALGTYLALTRVVSGASEDLAGELAQIQSLFETEGPTGLSDAITDTADSMAALIEQARRENEQLTALKAAHEGYGASVEIVNRMIEIDNALRAAKVSRLEAERSGLLKVLVANQRLRAEIEATTKAEEDLAKASKAAAVTAEVRAQEAAADRTADLIAEPFKNALRSIQSEVSNTFEEIYSGGVKTFEDIASAVTSIFTRLAAEMTTLLIFNPQVIFGGAGGAGAAGSSIASAFGGGGFGGFFGGGAGVANPAAGGTTTGPGGLLVGGGVTSSNGAAAASSGFGSSLSAGFGAGLAGVGAGTTAGGLLGGNQTGALVGSAVGAIAGGVIGSFVPVIGTAIGAFAGGALGGLIGGFVGGGDKENEGDLRFSSNTGGSGPFGGFSIGGENSFADPLANIIGTFDEGVAEFLTRREEEIVAAALQALPEFDGRFPESDPSEGFFKILSQRAREVLETGFPGISADAVLEGTGSVEDIGRNLEAALEAQKQIDELTQSQTAAAKLRREVHAVRESFDELRATAEEFGIATDGLAAAEKRAIAALREQNEALKEQHRAQVELQREQRRAQRQAVQTEINTLLLGGGPAAEYAAALIALDARFRTARKEARELGISIEGLAEAEAAAKRVLREQLRAEIDTRLLSISAQFDALAEPIQAFQTRLEFSQLNPLAQFEAAGDDFKRISKLAKGGSLTAINQLVGAGQLFIDLAGKVGASPLVAETIAKVQAANATVLTSIEEAQRKASRGIEDAIDRANREQVDTLRELIVETREVKREIRKLQREKARVA